ncbi:Seven transmembrane MLO family protein isoform 2 [Tripterygium wilfordii]|uniref:MLO-like protein n=1 Tax=Tripterygium wilfordii TaxID=458696 RepID=A0A7J7CGL6_TRIWF|nr:MLO-like protein 4 [Tripterygium wilfordii]KAF5733186.1 Seven transmembrane MLO family protein isoform 2 [Tripterygium wilfordii]
MGEELIRQGRSLAETPTYSVASVITVLVFVCLLVQRSIYRFGRWLKKTRRKALFASLEKIKEELMLLGLISLLLAQWARWISEICVDSSLFSSRFYICSENDYGVTKAILFKRLSSPLNESDIPPKGLYPRGAHQCGEGREPFVSLEGLEQLHRFLFVLGITHVLYSCLAVGLAMSKIYSWKKWENQIIVADAILQAKKNKVMKHQSSFVLHHTSHPWSRNRVLIWMLCFFRQFKSSIKKSDYLALRLGFITKHNLPLSYNFHSYMVRSMEDEFHGILGISWPLWVYAILCIFINIHGLNIYFWLSFIPAIIVMIVGTKLQHIVSSLALEIVEQAGPSITQVKPRDDLFWFRKPEILLRLIQFIIFQNAFEIATYIWSLWGLKERSCFMKNHYMIIIRLASGVLVQFWCSYSTVPLNVIVTQMGSRCKKALVAESVRESLHSWCKRVKDKSKRDSTARSVCSLDTATIDERDEITVASGTISHCSSLGSLNEVTIGHTEQAESFVGNPIPPSAGYSFRMEVYDASQPFSNSSEGYSDNVDETKVETLSDLFKKT